MAAPMNIDLSVWNHVGFTEGSYETPVRGAAEPSSDNLIYSTIGMRPPTVKDLFSFLKLKASYEDLKGALYLKMTLHYASGSSEVFYGWVDGVSLLSSSYEHIPDSIVNIWDVVGISWHVDLWRTYISKVELGRGVILRRPQMQSRDTPPQSLPFYSKKRSSEPVPLLNPTDNHGIWWVVFSFTAENDSGDSVGLSYGAIAFSLTPNAASRIDDVLYGLSHGDTTHFPSLMYILSGRWPEIVGLAPSRITGAFLSPICPVDYDYHWDGVYGKHRVELKDSRWYFADNMIQTNTAYIGNAGLNPSLFDEREDDTTIILSTTDWREMALTGFAGEPLAVLPFDKVPNHYRYRLVASATDFYIRVSFNDSTLPGPAVYQRLDSTLGSLSFDIPLPTVDVSQNSYSEYVYSGTRDYYRNMLKENLRYQREVEKVDAITNIGVGAATSSIGLIAGPAGVTAGLGGITGGITTLISQDIHKNLALEERHNATVLSQRDAYAAHQTEGFQLSGTGFDIVFYGVPISLVMREIDDYSLINFIKETTTYGYKVFEPETSCDTWVDTAGPIMIDDLNIVPAKISPSGPARYDVPVEAIQYIKARLKRGVLLV